MIALRAERTSAAINIQAISQLSTVPPAPVPKIFEAKLTKIVFGSTSAVLPSAWLPSTRTKATGIIV